MVRKDSIIALKADPGDPDDFDVTEAAVEQGLAERRARRGRPAGSDKRQVTLRIDVDILDRYKAGGAGWQTRINDDLRKVSGV